MSRQAAGHLAGRQLGGDECTRGSRCCSRCISSAAWAPFSGCFDACLQRAHCGRQGAGPWRCIPIWRLGGCLYCHCHEGVNAVTAARWHSGLCEERVQSCIGPWRLASTPRTAAARGGPACCALLCQLIQGRVSAVGPAGAADASGEVFRMQGFLGRNSIARPAAFAIDVEAGPSSHCMLQGNAARE